MAKGNVFHFWNLKEFASTQEGRACGKWHLLGALFMIAIFAQNWLFSPVFSWILLFRRRITRLPRSCIIPIIKTPRNCALTTAVSHAGRLPIAKMYEKNREKKTFCSPRIKYPVPRLPNVLDHLVGRAEEVAKLAGNQRVDEGENTQHPENWTNVITY